METTVAVDIWAMDSDSGYVPSHGHGDVYVVPAEMVAEIDGEKALYRAVEDCDVIDPLKVEEVKDAKPYSHKNGACNYDGVKGTYDVPGGMVAVQTWYYNISTADDIDYGAKILNSVDLKALYQKLAERYANLAATA